MSARPKALPSAGAKPTGLPGAPPKKNVSESKDNINNLNNTVDISNSNSLIPESRSGSVVNKSESLSNNTNSITNKDSTATTAPTRSTTTTASQSESPAAAAVVSKPASPNKPQFGALPTKIQSSEAPPGGSLSRANDSQAITSEMSVPAPPTSSPQRPQITMPKAPVKAAALPAFVPPGRPSPTVSPVKKESSKSQSQDQQQRKTDSESQQQATSQQPQSQSQQQSKTSLSPTNSNKDSLTQSGTGEKAVNTPVVNQTPNSKVKAGFTPGGLHNLSAIQAAASPVTVSNTKKPETVAAAETTKDGKDTKDINKDLNKDQQESSTAATASTLAAKKTKRITVKKLVKKPPKRKDGAVEELDVTGTTEIMGEGDSSPQRESEIKADREKLEKTKMALAKKFGGGLPQSPVKVSNTGISGCGTGNSGTSNPKPQAATAVEEDDYSGSDSDCSFGGRDTEGNTNDAGVRGSDTATGVTPASGASDRHEADLQLYNHLLKKHFVKMHQVMPIKDVFKSERADADGEDVGLEDTDNEHELEFKKIYNDARCDYDMEVGQRIIAKEEWEELLIIKPLLDGDAVNELFSAKVEEQERIAKEEKEKRRAEKEREKLERKNLQQLTALKDDNNFNMNDDDGANAEEKKTLEYHAIVHDVEPVQSKKWFASIGSKLANPLGSSQPPKNKHLELASQGVPLLHDQNTQISGDISKWVRNGMRENFVCKNSDNLTVPFYLSEEEIILNKTLSPTKSVKSLKCQTHVYLHAIFNRSIKVMKIGSNGRGVERWLEFGTQSLNVLPIKQQSSQMMSSKEAASASKQNNDGGEEYERCIPWNSILQVYALPQGVSTNGASSSNKGSTTGTGSSSTKDINNDLLKAYDDDSTSKQSMFLQYRTVSGTKRGLYVCFYSERELEIGLCCVCHLAKHEGYKSKPKDAPDGIKDKKNKGSDDDGNPIVKRIKYNRDNYYLGEVTTENRRHGRGAIFTRDGIFSGYWHQDQRQGPGVESHTDGTLFQGNFDNGDRSGFGFMRWQDSSQYEGIFAGGHAEGAGVLVRSDRSQYEGQFRKDAMHGFGSMIWSDGTKYIGQFSNNRRHGVGAMYWVRSKKWKRYYGEWCEGKQEGIGVLSLNDGTKCPGLFHGGSLQHWM